MPTREANALLLIRQLRKNIDALERAIATANHAIVQSRAMLRQLEDREPEMEPIRRHRHLEPLS